MEGWIKLHRQFVNWEWFNDSKTVHVFIYLLSMACHKEKKFRGEVIKPGQLMTGRKRIAADTNLSEQNVRTCLEHLKSTNEVTIKSTKKYSVITIVNWELYQQTNQVSNQQVTNNQPTTNQQVTTYKNVNNEKNERSNTLTPFQNNKIMFEAIREKNEMYLDLVSRLSDKYPNPNDFIMKQVESFYIYWTEPNKKGTKERWEDQKTFDVPRRLYTWFSRAKPQKQVYGGRREL